MTGRVTCDGQRLKMVLTRFHLLQTYLQLPWTIMNLTLSHIIPLIPFTLNKLSPRCWSCTNPFSSPTLIPHKALSQHPYHLNIFYSTLIQALFHATQFCATSFLPKLIILISQAPFKKSSFPSNRNILLDKVRSIYNNLNAIFRRWKMCWLSTEFKIEGGLEKTIADALASYESRTSALGVNIYESDVFGKSFCKKHKVSPDAMMQLGFQVRFATPSAS